MNLLVDHEGVLTLIRNPIVRNKYPFLRFAARQLKANNKKPCCGKTNNYKSPADIIETVKQSILGMNEDHLSLFKRDAKVDTLTISVNTPKGVKTFTK